MGPMDLIIKLILLVTVPTALAGGKPVSDGTPPSSTTQAPTAFTLTYPFAEGSVWQDAAHVSSSVVLEHADQEWHFAVSGNTFVPGANDSWFIYGLHGYQAASRTVGGPTYSQWAGRHDGTDFVAASGLPVRAAADGTVIFVGRLFGRTIIVQHRDGYQTTYGYLGETSVDPGASVKTGQRLGTVAGAPGESGYLHFALEQATDEGQDAQVSAINPIRFWDLSEALVPRSGYNSFYNGPSSPELQLDFEWDRAAYLKLR